jgi:ketohexokinase/beta-glucosidase
MDQWNQILWSDETWVQSFRHRKTYITRKAGEELEDTCIVEKPRKTGGWMFWGSFHGNIKGPSLFWEKKWGNITAESYCRHTVPIIANYIQANADPLFGPLLEFMHDNAPGHAAVETVAEMQKREIYTIQWPAFSPDLNPIEAVWNKMKDWMEKEYPDNPLETSSKAQYRRLRAQVTAAWEAIGQDYLQELVESMPERCLDVILANGGHTKW